MARLALILEALRIEADVWVVAVHIVQPYGVVHDLAQLLMAYLTQATIYGHAIIDIGSPGPEPRLAFVELFLGQHRLAPLGMYGLPELHWRLREKEPLFTARGLYRKEVTYGKQTGPELCAQVLTISLYLVFTATHCHALPSFSTPIFDEVEQVVQGNKVSHITLKTE